MASILPLLALRTFVEVGKQGSIKAAAQALNVTSGAVSQQIRLLEDRIGFSLFIRERYGLSLTEAGASVYPTLLKAFGEIEEVVRTLKEVHTHETLTVSTVATFAASWLVPRLGRFTQQHPEIEVRVEATSALVDLKRDQVDVAIRHGLGFYPNLQVTRLMAPVLIPVARPGLVTLDCLIQEPEDCLKYPLLHDSDRADWSLWFAAHNIEKNPRAERGSSFEDDFLLIRAAEAGQGLALVQQSYAQEEIAAGRLVQVLDKPWPARFAYYIVSQSNSQHKRILIEIFTKWLLKEASGSVR